MRECGEPYRNDKLQTVCSIYHYPKKIRKKSTTLEVDTDEDFVFESEVDSDEDLVFESTNICLGRSRSSKG